MEIRLLASKLAAFERGLVEDAIRASGGNIAATARHLGVERSYFYRKIRNLGIDLDWVRSDALAARSNARKSASPSVTPSQQTP